MLGRTRLLILALTAGAVAPLLADVPEAGPLLPPSSLEMEVNRRRLEELRGEPNHLAKVRQSAKAFFALPKDRQSHIIEIQHKLQEQPATTQARLQDVLSRYVAWLERLPDADRQRVSDAATAKARLEVIQELRDREWLQYQPKVVRAEYAQLKTRTAQQEMVKTLRLKARQFNDHWTIVARFWGELTAKPSLPLPARLTDFSADVQSYVNDYLRLFLSEEERSRLDKAQGQWPGYPMTLVEIADGHPLALPSGNGPTLVSQLPNDVQKRAKMKGMAFKSVKAKEGKWPDFGNAFAGYAAQRELNLPHELWAANLPALSKDMQEFVMKKLLPILSSEEEQKLNSAAKKWPDYPNTIQELARVHQLYVPWSTLPGPRERWDKYRISRPGPTLN